MLLRCLNNSLVSTLTLDLCHRRLCRTASLFPARTKDFILIIYRYIHTSSVARSGLASFCRIRIHTASPSWKWIRIRPACCTVGYLIYLINFLEHLVNTTSNCLKILCPVQADKIEMSFWTLFSSFRIRVELESWICIRICKKLWDPQRCIQFTFLCSD
jgi:hypothetical protein